MLSLRHRLGALHSLASGGVIAYPTESVWGLGCDPFNEFAVDHLLEMKQRPRHKGLILVAASQAQIAPLLTDLAPDQRALLNASWPGPVTWLIPDPANRIPAWIKGDFASVAVRVSAHPVVRELCLAWGGPLVSTSANRAGRAPLRNGWPLYHHRFLQPDYLVPGATQQLIKPTEIRDLTSGRILRAG